MSYAKELAAAKKAVSLAARLSQKVQKSLSETDIWTKSDSSPVTVADYGSQAIVNLVLEKELHPEPLSLVAEEDSADLRKIGAESVLARITELVKDTLATDESCGASPLSSDDVLSAIDRGKSEGGPKGRHWILDPIGGTRGFIRGEQYAVGLALLVEGKVVLGVMACPRLPLESTAFNIQKSSPGKVGCLFFAAIGSGTYAQSLNGLSPPEKVQVSSVDDPEKATFFESYHTPVPFHSSIAKKLGIKAFPIRVNSQTKYAALSRGDGEVYLRFTRKAESIWNHAAGSVVVSEAGGIVSDAEGNPLDFSKGKYLSYKTGIIATTQKLMPRLLKAVRESMEEEKFNNL
ncbi:PREDICTED: probable SAL3 phosphatase [Tarenaya hassleriana]|uniref:probable SAL3 phosphatase n=1 Tax=Tarenaya hassleriana TaxID=28532 RepID=UPI00053C1F89|nr:PREDICTED: probable SAL3 phosphatase [Tarenaya hassleriana]